MASDDFPLNASQVKKFLPVASLARSSSCIEPRIALFVSSKVKGEEEKRMKMMMMRTARREKIPPFLRTKARSWALNYPYEFIP